MDMNIAAVVPPVADRIAPISKCSQPGLVREAGCLACVHCGWSKCC